MKVLVTGSEGYIGSRLVPILFSHGFDVVGFDTGYYRDGWLFSDNQHMPTGARTIYKDLRRITEAGANVDVFRRADPPASGPTMMVRSPYACVGCHQQ